MKNILIGIDVSKDTLDYCCIDINTFEKISSGTTKNDIRNIKKWINSFDINTVEFSMENTGHYGALLVTILDEFNAQFYIINPLDLKKSLGIQRGKTDTLDAYRIACYTVSINTNYQVVSLLKLRPLLLQDRNL